MPHLLVTMRLARRHITTARELRRRWDALPPAQQQATHAEVERLSEVARDVGRRLAHGPREFRREFDAARAGEDIEAAPPPPSLGAIVRDLGSAIDALRRAMADATREPEAARLDAPTDAGRSAD